MSVNFTTKTRGQEYKFTDTTLFINRKPYPYEKLKVIKYHKGNILLNSWYELLFDGKKKLIIGYKPSPEKEEGFKNVFDYIKDFNNAARQEYLANVRTFEFLVDDERAAPADEPSYQQNIKTVIQSFFNTYPKFYLSDYVFDGEICILEYDDGNLDIEIYMYDAQENSHLIGFVPQKFMKEMIPFLDENTAYDLRMTASGFGRKNNKLYIVTALLKFDKRAKQRILYN